MGRVAHTQEEKIRIIKINKESYYFKEIEIVKIVANLDKITTRKNLKVNGPEFVSKYIQQIDQYFQLSGNKPSSISMK